MPLSAHTQVQAPATPAGMRWRLNDIGFDAIDRRLVADDPLTFRIVLLASFIETGSDLYADNLVEFFAGDAELARWLGEVWKPEEVQHGHALRTYAAHAWPEIDWQRRFDEFFATYSRLCTVDQLEAARALELASRCVVETGTATFYSALCDYAREPVLKDLAARIFADEIRHYKYFYRHFRRYQQRERHSRWRIGQTLLRRFFETKTSDGYLAYRQLGDPRPDETDATASDADYRAFAHSFATFVQRHGPREMPIRMLLRPLQLPAAFVARLARHGNLLYLLWQGSSAWKGTPALSVADPHVAP